MILNMPKTKSSVSNRLSNYVSEYGNDIFSCDGEVLFCKVCDVKVSALKQFTVEQHVNREKHTRGVKRQKEEKSKTQLLLKYAPITSVDVERSFSSCKHLFTDRRRRLLFENIRHILIIHCNNAI